MNFPSMYAKIFLGIFIATLFLPSLAWGDTPPDPDFIPDTSGLDTIPEENGDTSEDIISGEEAGKAFIAFLRWLFSFLLSLAAILALIMIILAGFKWIGAAGNPSTITDAKDMIGKAIMGLILAFAAWLILNTINPALVAGTLPGGSDEENNMGSVGLPWRCTDSTGAKVKAATEEICDLSCDGTCTYWEALCTSNSERFEDIAQCQSSGCSTCVTTSPGDEENNQESSWKCIIKNPDGSIDEIIGGLPDEATCEAQDTKCVGNCTEEQLN